MSEISWSNVLDIGLPVVDEQHKELIALSNGLIQAMVNGMGNDVLEDIFKELRDYTQKHFSEEEKYMEEINYPGLAGQKAAHAQLIADVDEFHILLESKSVTPNQALDFINDWIIKHIMEMDSKIGEYARTL